MSTHEMQATVSELRELRRMKEELEAQMEALTDTIKAEMLAKQIDTLQGIDFKATWKEVQSTRLDGKALKAAMPELYERFARATQSKRFVLQ